MAVGVRRQAGCRQGAAGVTSDARNPDHSGILQRMRLRKLFFSEFDIETSVPILYRSTRNERFVTIYQMSVRYITML